MMAFWIFSTFIPLLRFSISAWVNFDNSDLPPEAVYEARRIMPMSLISRACEYVILHGKRGFADVTNIKNLEMGRMS